jgi:leader peptidase (prepilin peptidase)/N-methyltransferase
MIFPITPWVLVPLVYLAAVSVPLAVTDARTLRLPNALVVPGLVLLAWALVGVGVHDPPAVVPPLLGSSAAAIVLGLGFASGAVGMGDVKLALLLAGVAALTDARILPSAAIAAAALLAVPALCSVATSIRAGGTTTATRIPFGPPLLAGFWFGVVAVWFER